MLRNVGIQARGTDPGRLSQKVSNPKKYRIPLGPRPFSSGCYLEAEHDQTVRRQVISGPDVNQRLSACGGRRECLKDRAYPHVLVA
jgi:hypothetical protein